MCMCPRYVCRYMCAVGPKVVSPFPSCVRLSLYVCASVAHRPCAPRKFLPLCVYTHASRCTLCIYIYIHTRTPCCGKSFARLRARWHCKFVAAPNDESVCLYMWGGGGGGGGGGGER